MKIAIDARFYGLEHAGLGRYTTNLIRELQKIDDKNKYYLLLRRKYFDTLKISGRWQKVLVDIPHYTLREQLLLPRIIKKINPDIFHSLQINYPVLYGGLSIVTLHDLTQLSYTKKATTLPTPLYLVKHLALKRVVKKALHKSGKVIVPSKSVGRDLIDIHNIDKKKLKVIYEGVSINDMVQENTVIPKKFRIEGKYFLYIGNAYPHKNLGRLMEAMKRLNSSRKEKILLVIGGVRDVFKIRIDNNIIKANSQEYIKTIGYIPDEYMKNIYEKSVAFVYPSLSEGFGLQGLEAMRSGTLLLASDIPVFREIYGKNALFFNPFDFSTIEKALEEALSMKKKMRNSKIEKSKEFSKKYSWKKMAYETLRVYNSLN